MTKQTIKTIIPTALAALTVCATEPSWELGRDPMAAVTGKVQLVDNAVLIDGSNSFSLPTDALGDQTDYTIEFVIKRRAIEGQADSDFLQVVSTMEEGKENGLAYGLVSYDTGWRATSLTINGHRALSPKAFKPGTAYKVTLVAQNGQLMLFIDGLLLGMTDAVKPSARPLTFGELSDVPILPYELSSIRIYDQTTVPTGYDPSTKMMRTFSGEGYSMQRVDITDTSLPRILIIGDSISMGYRRYITEHFAGKAYVDYWVSPLMFKLQPEDVAPVNTAWTGVLANGPYDVVSWNHASLHTWDPNRPERCSPDTYPKLMAKIATHAKKTAPATQFFWVRCTPIVKFKGDDKVPHLDAPENQRIIMFNDLTDTVMADTGIPSIDLYQICEDNLALVGRDGVHWQHDAYKLMAQAIIDAATPYLKHKK